MRISAVSATITLALVAMAASGCSSSAKSSTTAGGSAAPAAGSTASGSAPASAAAAGGGGGSADINACTLLSAAQASSLVGKTYTGAQSQTIATGQDQCTYPATDDDSSLIVIVYQPNSGVTWDTMTTVLQSVGTVNNVSGVGDKAMIGAIEIDVQTGSRLVAVQGAGGTVSGHPDNAIAVAKAVVGALG
jgi:hypothetical protein